MALVTRCSGYLEVHDGQLFQLIRSFSTSDQISYDKVIHPPKRFVLSPLAVDQKILLWDITTVRMLFIETDIDDITHLNKQVNVKIGSSTNTNLVVVGFLQMLCNFVNDMDPMSTTGLFMSNPSSTTAVTVTVSAVGT